MEGRINRFDIPEATAAALEVPTTTVGGFARLDESVPSKRVSVDVLMFGRALTEWPYSQLSLGLIPAVAGTNRHIYYPLVLFGEVSHVSRIITEATADFNRAQATISHLPTLQFGLTSYRFLF